MRRDIQVYLKEMQRIIAELEGFVEGRTLENFLGDTLLLRGVERDYEIIAEILRRMIAASDETTSRISDSQRIIGFRNLLAHEYHKTTEVKVWEITEQSLPILKQQINAWADELGMGPLPGQTA